MLGVGLYGFLVSLGDRPAVPDRLASDEDAADETVVMAGTS